MSSAWVDWFSKNVAQAGGFFKFCYNSWVYSAPFYNSIHELLPPPRKVLEIGCGIGTSTIILSLLGYNITAIDIDLPMLEETRRNLHSFGMPEKAELELGNALDLSKYYKKFDIAFSSGVLEHFKIADAIAALREQSKAATHVAVQIPTRYLAEKDDRVYRYPHTPHSLRWICGEAGLQVMKFIALGDPGQSLAVLRRILPAAVWYHLRKEFFAVSVAAICRSSEHEAPMIGNPKSCRM